MSASRENPVSQGAVTRGGWVPSGVGERRRQTHATKARPRGKRTRSRILDAARVVFEREGYVLATVDAIVDEAGIAKGSFYTYFASKLDVFRVLVDEVLESIVSAGMSRPASSSSSITLLEHSLRQYLETYRANWRMFDLMQQVGSMDETVREQRLKVGREQVARVAQSIRGLQSRHKADRALDPDLTAALMLSMVSGFAYWWSVGGGSYDDEEQMVRNIAQVWANAVGLKPAAATA
jgi:cbb3-type cytochrome oxidase maturation protein